MTLPTKYGCAQAGQAAGDGPTDLRDRRQGMLNSMPESSPQKQNRGQRPTWDPPRLERAELESDPGLQRLPTALRGSDLPPASWSVL